MKSRHLAALVLLLAAAVLFWKTTRPEPQADSQATAAEVDTRRRDVPRPDSPDFLPDGSSPAPAAAPEKPGEAAASADEEGPAVTRASRRRETVSSDGVRRSVIDPMASWSELPAWPEGPRLFAEADTASRRYVNLRPDDVGELPRIRAEGAERIELRVIFPEGVPGEKIFVELPNGGSFADSDAKGRVFILPENRTLTFPYITDDARGHCNVKLRHRGHTRSLPVWIGELPEPGTADSES